MDFGAVVFKVKRKKYRVGTYQTFDWGGQMDLGGVVLRN